MKTRHISLFILLLALIYSLPSSAQEMTVKSMVPTNDQTANLSENMLKDNNGDYAGLVKVMLAAPNVDFEGLVLKKQVHTASEHWVFMAKGSTRLKVTVPGYLPLPIDFRDYGINGIEPLRTYVLTITLPQVGAIQQDDGMRYLAMTVEPKNSTVFIDGIQRAVKNGEVKVLLPMGSHRYQVSAIDHEVKEGTVVVGDDTTPLEIRLDSSLATLEVDCATPGAHIFINGESKGNAPWSGTLSPGNYKVEARLDGYRPQQQSVTLVESGSQKVSMPALQLISGTLNVDYSPIGSDVLVDGKKVGASPKIFRGIPVGPHRVEIRKDGYRPFSQSVTIAENKQTDITGSLTATSSSSSSTSTNATASSSSSGVSDQSGTSSTSFSSDKETFTVNGVSFTMIRVNGGTFMMGATDEQGNDALYDEKPAHEVTLSTYMIGETEVTQALWQAVMGSNPSSYNYWHKDNPNTQNPVERVSWNDCQKFIKKLNKLTGKSFRLPTEAEWEFAARGGNKSKHYKYSGSNTLEEVAWYPGNSGRNSHPVKSKSPNELGIYDMTGNVQEWCEDWYSPDYYKSSPKFNPSGPSTVFDRRMYGRSKVVRDLYYGSIGVSDGEFHISNRDYWHLDEDSHFIGFRLAL